MCFGWAVLILKPAAIALNERKNIRANMQLFPSGDDFAKRESARCDVVRFRGEVLQRHVGKKQPFDLAIFDETKQIRRVVFGRVVRHLKVLPWHRVLKTS